ncbi:MAG: HAD-IB family phosphatase [Gemmatimonadaceae bacterium]
MSGFDAPSSNHTHPFVRPRFASVVFDADSTLASIEGIDWLGAQRGDDAGREIQQLTDRAMSGELALERVYAARLDFIKPTRDEIAMLGAVYVAAVEDGAAQLVGELQRAGVRVEIVSGGLREALLPLADHLGIPRDSVHAVELAFDARGVFESLAPAQWLSQQDGKPRVVHNLALPRRSAMIGDGSTDAAVRGVTDVFFAYTAVARRPLVVAEADAEASSFAELRVLLFEPAVS